MEYRKKLIGKHIYLAPLRVENAEKYAEWFCDFETTDYLGKSSSIVSVEAEEEWILKHQEDEACFAIVTLADNKLIGNVGINNVDHLNRTGTLGIFIGDKGYRNKGYGTEAIQLLLEYGFKYLNLNNIKLDVMAFNERAIRCYQKCGFKEYGRRRKCYFLNGTYYDKIEMDILAEEFTGDYIQNKNI